MELSQAEVSRFQHVCSTSAKVRFEIKSRMFGDTVITGANIDIPSRITVYHRLVNGTGTITTNGYYERDKMNADSPQ